MGKRTVTKRTHQVGVVALARETGMPQSTVSLKMRQGYTPDQIRQMARMREGLAPKGASISSPKPPEEQAPAPGTSEYDLVVRGQERMEAIDQAKLRRAEALAERQELENALKRGELIPVAYARKWGSRFIIDGRDELLKMPSELQDIMATESDPARCAAIMQSYLERVLAKWQRLEELWSGGVAVEEKVA